MPLCLQHGAHHVKQARKHSLACIIATRAPPQSQPSAPQPLPAIPPPPHTPFCADLRCLVGLTQNGGDLVQHERPAELDAHIDALQRQGAQQAPLVTAHQRAQQRPAAAALRGRPRCACALRLDNGGWRAEGIVLMKPAAAIAASTARWLHGAAPWDTRLPQPSRPGRLACAAVAATSERHCRSNGPYSASVFSAAGSWNKSPNRRVRRWPCGWVRREGVGCTQQLLARSAWADGPVRAAKSRAQEQPAPQQLQICLALYSKLEYQRKRR